MNKTLSTGFIVAIVVMVMLSGCIDEAPIPTPTPSPNTTSTITPTPIATPTPSPIQSPVPDANQSEEEKLRIGAFNIQVFGQPKRPSPK